VSAALRLLVVTTHPIQYMAPWYRQLAGEAWLDLEVVFFRELDPQAQGAGFGCSFQWDVALREGYRSRVLGAGPGAAAVPGLLRRLRGVVEDLRPHAALVTGWNEPGLMGCYPLMKLLGVPVILRGESNSLRLRSAVTKLLHRLLLRFVAGVVVIGKANRQFYLDNGFSPDRLFGGAYFVESDRMSAMSEANAGSRAALRREQGFDEADFVFVFVGKHVAFKRPMLLVEAAALARRQGLRVTLLFAGSGELTGALRKRAKALDVPARFTGFLNQTEMWKAYVPADAFALPSTDRETWGLVTNEAMLFGLPVIVSDQVGCGPDLVIDGETGYRFTGGADGLAEAMGRLTRDRDRARAMGLAGRKLVLERYSMPVATAGLKAAFAAVCGRDLR
jgi:glycosyltransferase involved in cell wall biosynthesis